MEEVHKYSVYELSSLIGKREISIKELIEVYLDRIKELDKEVNAFITVCGDEALRYAEESDKRWKEGKPLSPFDGIPIAIKDNILVKGIRTTCASKILENYIAVYDATVVERLKKKGFIVLGKTNLDEFAMGSSTENSYFGVTRNPYDLERVPGGSSGGSAVSVAMNFVPVALGSDTGGSIRQPASFCGVIGLKPTYGRVSRYGLVAFGSSLDQIGPFANTIEDIAIVLSVISGYDYRDATSYRGKPEDYLSKILERHSIIGKKFCVIENFFKDGIEDEVKDKVLEVLKKIEDAGGIVEWKNIDILDYSVEIYYIIATAEASSNLGRYDGVRYGYRSEDSKDMLSLFMNSRGEGFGREVKRRILLGTYVLSAGYYSAYYLRAQKARSKMIQDIKNVFEEYDFLIAPTSPSLPFRIGEKAKDPIKMYLSDVYTIFANLVGIPAISIPVGFSKENLPIGMQIFTKHFNEVELLQTSKEVLDIL
jgi:aspartyl-tRNA(Asn)/glutamyl-tRNA(Gln) amidotransferase subunit A